MPLESLGSTAHSSFAWLFLFCSAFWNLLAVLIWFYKHDLDLLLVLVCVGARLFNWATLDSFLLVGMICWNVFLCYSWFVNCVFNLTSTWSFTWNNTPCELISIMILVVYCSSMLRRLYFYISVLRDTWLFILFYGFYNL